MQDTIERDAQGRRVVRLEPAEYWRLSALVSRCDVAQAQARAAAAALQAAHAAVLEAQRAAAAFRDSLPAAAPLASGAWVADDATGTWVEQAPPATAVGPS